MFFGIKINLKNFTKTAIRNKFLCTFALEYIKDAEMNNYFRIIKGTGGSRTLPSRPQGTEREKSLKICVPLFSSFFPFFIGESNK